MEIIVVYKDEDFVFVMFQVVVPSLQSLNNGQEVLIISFAIGLSENYLSKEKSY